MTAQTPLPEGVSRPVKRGLSTLVRVLNRIEYEPETGALRWKPRPLRDFPCLAACNSWNRRFAGKEAGCVHQSGYHQISIDAKLYRSHRVAWLITTGDWPKGDIDHINGNKLDNRIANLRDVSHAENGRNQRIPSNNKSGHAGVRLRPDTGKWQAMIKVSGRDLYLGQFVDKADAIGARKAAEAQFGFHPNHGRAA